MTTAYNKFYINGEWVEPAGRETIDVINPATEEAFATISMGTAEDVDAAAKAARAAFPAWSQSSVEERKTVLQKIMAGIQARAGDLAAAITSEMGAPVGLANAAQVPSGLGHFAAVLPVLENYKFQETRGSTLIVKEAAGVCGFITPWNWPLNQIACKVAPALAAGCTIVLKPSEVAPINAYILAEIIDECGLPPGVFNLVNGDGPNVGAAISAHPEVDVVSFTGSTRAGREVARAAADGIKRVTQELGGKSANIILDDTADFGKAVFSGVLNCFGNSGQSCNAPTRMLVPKARMGEAIESAKAAAAKAVVGDPNSEGTSLGPVVSELQFNKINALIEAGIKEGAELIAGGPGRPDGLDKGYFIKPTVFANVTNDMTIAREEVFGPVLGIMPFDTEQQAWNLANGTDYGLVAGIFSNDINRCLRGSRALRAGQVFVNEWYAGGIETPFGGTGLSGFGREKGQEALYSYVQTKNIAIRIS